MDAEAKAAFQASVVLGDVLSSVEIYTGRIFPPDTYVDLQHHADAISRGAECWRCPLLACGRGPVPPTLPNGPIDLLVVAEAPGSNEVREGRVLIGASGRELRKALEQTRIDMTRVGLTNSMSCMPEGGDLKKYLQQCKKKGEPSPIECCAPRLQEELARAAFVLLMGGASLTAAGIGGSIMKTRGTPLRIPSTGAPALATPHAAFVLRDEGARYRPVFHADITKAVRLAYGGNTWKDPAYFVPKTAAEATNFLAVSRPRVSVDIETDGIDRWLCNLRRVGIGDDKEVMIFAPLSVKGHALLTADNAMAQARVIGDYFQRAPRIDTHNGIAFDSVVLNRYGMAIPDANHYDNMVAHQVGVTSELPHGLDFCGSMYTDAPHWKDSFKHSNVPSDAILDKYLSFDIAVTHTSAAFTEYNLATYGQQHIYTLDSELFRIGRAMSALGIYIDPVKRFEFAQEYQQKSDKLRAEFVAVAGRDVNPGSPVQVRKLLYEELGLPVLITHLTDSDEPSTDENTLLDLLSLGVDARAQKIIHGLIGYREAEKILGTNTGHVENGVLVGGPPVHVDGAVRTSWRPGKTAGRWGSSDPINCFSGDTEVLTHEGWTRFDKLKRGVSVAQWRDGLIEFVEPTDYYEGVDELLHIKLRGIDLMVTPGHRCALRRKINKQMRVFRADEFPKTQAWQQVHSGVYHGGRTNVGAPFLRLLVAAQADGTYGYGDRLSFTFVKRRKVKRIVSILDACGAKYKTALHRGGRRHVEVRGSVALRCRDILGPNKRFGSWVLELTREQMDLFCTELFFWDGSWTRKNNYSSSDRVNVDFAQAAFLLSGKRARMRSYRNATPNARLNYQIDTVDRDWSGVANRKITSQGRQRVYCVSVPSSYILVRRNGTAVVTGQCQNIPKKIRAMFVPRAGNVFVAADMQAVELRMIALLAGDEPLITAFNAFDAKTGPDVHVANACSVFRCQPEAVNDEVRNFIKRFVYALNYGAEPPKIYQTLSLLRDDNLQPLFPHITLQEVERVFNIWWQLHPAIIEWKKKGIYGWRARRYMETEYHKRKRFFIGGESPTEQANFPIQGAAADLQNAAIQALVRAYPFDFERHRGLLINGHDQLVVECAAGEAEDVKKIVEACMQKRLGKMMFPATAKAADSWKAVS